EWADGLARALWRLERRPDPGRRLRCGMSELPKPARGVPRRAFRLGQWSAGSRTIAEEAAIAFTYDRATYAVMMATPADLEDFAVGFSLSEQTIGSPDDIAALEVLPNDLG